MTLVLSECDANQLNLLKAVSMKKKKRFDLNGLYYLCRFVVVIFVSIAQRQTTCHIEYKARQPSRLSKCHSVTIHIAKTEKNAADFKFPTFFIHFHIFTTSFHS